MHWETKNSCDSLYCYIRFIEVVWNQTCHASEACLYMGKKSSKTLQAVQNHFNKAQNNQNYMVIYVCVLKLSIKTGKGMIPTTYRIMVASCGEAREGENMIQVMHW